VLERGYKTAPSAVVAPRDSVHPETISDLDRCLSQGERRAAVLLCPVEFARTGHPACQGEIIVSATKWDRLDHRNANQSGARHDVTRLDVLRSTVSCSSNDASL